jgi:hypothetical protein
MPSVSRKQLGVGRATLLLLALAPSACRTSVRGLEEPVDIDASVTGVATDLGVRVDVAAACLPAGATKKQIGGTCSCADECASGFCVDGLCCNNACAGLCRACNVPTSPGLCAPIPAGASPVVPGQCAAEPIASCGLDGTCDGAGGCRRFPDGTVCVPGKCQGALVTGAMVCVGGACKAGPTTSCSPYTCNATTGRCYSACVSAAQCDARECENKMCGKKPLGAACASAAECSSGSCADGVCCNVACTGACLRCNQAGKMGECVPVGAGVPDGHGVCKKEDPKSCGQSGLCNGLGGCAKYAAGTVCAGASCSGGSQIPTSVCDGAGTCLMGAPVSCAPFMCAGTACRESCTVNTECSGTNVCRNGSCGLKQNGQACTAGKECASTFCVDKVCCESTCGSACTYCAFPNSRGRCVNVPASVPDPRAQCVDRGPTACGTNGKCNGSRACQLYPNGTTCGPSGCDPATNRFTPESVCRAGLCTAAAARTCAPYRCNGGSCANSCSGSGDCVSPNICEAGSCGKKPLGGLCSRPGECDSGFCAQGVCCQNACTASCFACNQPGSAGTCAQVAAGAGDPAGTCKDEGPTSCGNDGTCNGMGGCRKYAAGTTCAAATCAAGMRKAASTCDGAGQCSSGAGGMCTPYTCNAGGTDCYAACSDDSQCVAPNHCDASGHCGKKKSGASCTDGSECESTFCIEGVCCATDCRSLCKSCALAGSLGTCTNVPSGGADPGGGCPLSAQDTCGNDGTCNGMAACRKWSASTQCRPPSCPAGTAVLTKAAFCDGNGTCPATQQTQPCAPFVCDSAAGACKTMCMGNGDCSEGVCLNGSCGKKALGAGCMTGPECDSGQCVDGTCCASNVCTTCQSCANPQGTCAPVGDDMPDPDSCTDQTGSETCGTVGKCDGTGHCKFASNVTPCGEMCGGDGTSVVTKTCNGSGSCTGTGGTTQCSPYVCVDNACATTCDPMTNSGCVQGKICIDNHCQDPPPPPEPGDDGGAPDVPIP